MTNGGTSKWAFGIRATWSITSTPGGLKVTHSLLFMGDGACSASIPGQNPVRKFDRGEIPPKHPVQKDGVVVGLLVVSLMADGEVIGDVEKCPFVFLEKVFLENVPAALRAPG